MQARSLSLAHLILIVVSVFAVAAQSAEGQAKTPGSGKKTPPGKVQSWGPRGLNLDEVLGWKDYYGNLVGKSKDVAIERFGPDFKEDGVRLDWTPNFKTRFRQVTIAVLDTKICWVKVAPSPYETVSVLDVLMKAPLFDFSSGTFSNSILGYFGASKKDTKDTFRWAATDHGLIFESMTFY